MKKIASSVKQILCVAVIGLCALCGKALRKAKAATHALEHVVAPAGKELKVGGGKLVHFSEWKQKMEPVLEVGKELKHCDHLVFQVVKNKLDEKRHNSGFTSVRFAPNRFKKTDFTSVQLQ